MAVGDALYMYPRSLLLSPQSSFSEVARLFTEFFRDLDVVPSDIVAGLVLLRQEQKQRRKWIVQQVCASNRTLRCTYDRRGYSSLYLAVRYQNTLQILLTIYSQALAFP